MTLLTPDDPRLRTSVEDLCEILERLRRLHEELLGVLGEKERALVEVRLDDLERLREREELLLRRVVEEERERLLVSEELGDLLEHEEPVSIRLGEILPHLSGRLAERLGRERNELREVALRLARQNSLNRALIEHSIGHVQVFLSKVACEEGGGPRYDGRGAAPGGEGGSFLMDRRA